MTTFFARAVLGKTTEKPVWLMRQAGRYLPEYRALRKRFPDFISFVRNADAAAEATLQPVNRFDMDAAILFSDILVTLPSMGFDLKFESGKGPVISNPFRDASCAKNLRQVRLENDLAYTKAALQKVRAKLSSEKSLLGFVGGPLTIASYAIEGGTSKDLHRTKSLFYNDSDAYAVLLNAVAETTGKYLALQVEWGADVLVIMDSWAGHLSGDDYQKMAKPYTDKVVSIVRQQTDAPIIHYANGASHLVADFIKSDFNVVGVDHRTDLANLLDKNPGKIFQGNLDQALLFANPEIIRERTQEILKTVGNRPHIMNLGHGVLPDTPLDGVRTFVDTIHGNHL